MKKTILLTLTILIFFGIAIFSYIEFSKYSPNQENISEIVKSDVQGVADSTVLAKFPIPLPIDHQVISFDSKTSGTTVNVKTAQTYGTLIEYYKSIMSSKKFQLKNEGYLTGFYNMTFFQGMKEANFNIYYSEVDKTTIISISTNFN